MLKLSSWEKSYSNSSNIINYNREIWQRKDEIGNVIAEVIYIKSFKSDKCFFALDKEMIYEITNSYYDYDLFNTKDEQGVVEESIDYVKINIDLYLKMIGFEIDRL